MNKIERFGEGIKSLVIGNRTVRFADTTGFGGNWGATYGGWASTKGAGYDYKATAGELWENRVVAACIQAVAQALADAPPVLEKRDGAGWSKVDNHPVIDLLNAPNKYHSAPHLWGMIAGSEITRGQGYLRIEKTAAGLPGELWPEDPLRFKPLGNADEFISGYEFRTERGSLVKLDNDQVIHFRYTLNPFNTREGRSPLQTGYRQVALDNGIASYHGAILRNSGVMSLLISLGKGAEDTNISANAIKEFTDGLKQKLFGEGAGGIVGLNAPLKVDRMSFSPDEMSVDKLVSYAEASICALCGVDPMVCSLGSGTQQKTYANFSEAINDFWERRIVPTKNRHAAELGSQLLPLYPDLLDRDGTVADYRIGWDYTNVAALQENEDELHTRWRENYKAGFVSMYDVRTALKLEADESMKERFANAGAPDMSAFEGDPVKARRPELKALSTGRLAAYDADVVLDALERAEPETRALMLAKVEGEE